jgi:hypothetical protein
MELPNRSSMGWTWDQSTYQLNHEGGLVSGPGRLMRILGHKPASLTG